MNKNTAMSNDEELITLIKNAAQEGQFHKIPTEEMELIYQHGFELTQNRPYDKELVNAVARFRAELRKRKNGKVNTRAYSDKSFRWGIVWIFMGFFQGGLAFFLGFIGGMTTEIIPNRGVGLLIGILGIGSSVGLLKRKIFGLYLVYAILALGALGSIIEIIGGTAYGIVAGIFIIGIEYLWFCYFQKRKDWFK